MVFAEVSELGLLDFFPSPVGNDFCYRFDIKGKFVDKYRFNVFFFAHDITLYPVKFHLDEKIGLELGLQKTAFGYDAIVASPEEMETFLQAVLTSERVKNVVGSIMQLSK
jgi:hypothetical protein